MQVTVLGYVLIPLGLYWALFKPRYLFLGTVFCVPFSASAVVNIDAVSFGLQPYQYLGILFILSQVFRTLATGRIRLAFRQRTPLLWLIAFWLSAGLSLLGPLLAVQVTTFNVTQLVHLSFGVWVTVACVLELNEHNNLQQAVSVFIGSGVFVALWGLLQFVCYHLGIPYPSELFNNSHSQASNGFLQVIGSAGTTRISSVAVEPSVFARVELAVFALLLVLVLVQRGGRVWTRYVLLVFVLAMLCLSTSSTAYIGLVVLAVVLLTRYFVRSFSILPLLVGLALAALVLVPGASQALSIMTVDKVESFSFLERFGSVTTAYRLFLDAPVFGRGWGSVLSYDLFVKLLSNVGLVGTISFAAFTLSSMTTGPKERPMGGAARLATTTVRLPSDLAMVQGLQVALTVALAADAFSGFSYVFGHLWILWGLLIGSRMTPAAPGHAVAPVRSA